MLQGKASLWVTPGCKNTLVRCLCTVQSVCKSQRAAETSQPASPIILNSFVCGFVFDLNLVPLVIKSNRAFGRAVCTFLQGQRHRLQPFHGADDKLIIWFSILLPVEGDPHFLNSLLIWRDSNSFSKCPKQQWASARGHISAVCSVLEVIWIIKL